MFVLSYVLPPVEGAAFGKATVFEPVTTLEAVHRHVLWVLRMEHQVPARKAAEFATALTHELISTARVHTGTGIVFRIDPEDNPPNVCPCCGRLVKPGDHAFAGDSDAYCDGCYTWNDASKISCGPHHSAHANPWTEDTDGARFSMEVVIDHDDETGHDVRYARSDAYEMWDDEGNALIAWPGLHPEQFISIEIKEI